MPFKGEDVLDGDCSRGGEKQKNDAAENELMGEMTEEDKREIEKKNKERERYDRGTEMATRFGKAKRGINAFCDDIGEELSRLRGIADPEESMYSHYGQRFKHAIEGISQKDDDYWEKVGDVYQGLVDEVTRQYPKGKENYKIDLQKLQQKKADAKANTIRGRASAAVQSARKKIGL